MSNTMVPAALVSLIVAYHAVQINCVQQRYIELPFGDAPTRRDFANEQHFQTFHQQAPAPVPAPPPTHRFGPSQVSPRGSTRHPVPTQPPLPIFQAQEQPQQVFEDPSTRFVPTRQFPVSAPRDLSEQEIQTLNAAASQPQNPNQFFNVEQPPVAPSHKPHIRRPQAPRFVPQQPQFIINEQPAIEERPQQPKFQGFPDFNSRQQQDYEEKLFKQQATNAKYSFASQIDDTISGNQHEREESRDGGAVKGKYSYSDGYVKRTVFYEADDKGYRVVKEEVEPLGDGPQVNPNGHANVRSFVAGNQLQYSITGADIQDTQKNLPQQQPHRPLRQF